MGKYTRWYDNQNATTKAYLDKQPIWRDCDIFAAMGVGLAIGILMGLTVACIIS